MPVQIAAHVTKLANFSTSVSCLTNVAEFIQKHQSSNACSMFNIPCIGDGLEDVLKLLEVLN